MAEDTRTPREPWKGYAALSEDDRKAALQKKVQDALDQGAADYAFALAAAAYNYELVQDLKPDATAAPSVADAAAQLHTDAGSWRGN